MRENPELAECENLMLPETNIEKPTTQERQLEDLTLKQVQEFLEKTYGITATETEKQLRIALNGTRRENKRSNTRLDESKWTIKKAGENQLDLICGYSTHRFSLLPFIKNGKNSIFLRHLGNLSMLKHTALL